MKHLLRIAAIGLFALMASGPLRAQQLPSIVQQNLQRLVMDCDGKLDVARRSLRSIDLNDDGNPDWVLDTSELGCEMESYYCGTAGCTLMIFVSNGGSHAVAWDGNVHGWRAIKVRGKPGIHFDLHGSACNRSGHLGCAQRYVFEGGRLIRAR